MYYFITSLLIFFILPCGHSDFECQQYRDCQYRRSVYISVQRKCSWTCQGHFSCLHPFARNLCLLMNQSRVESTQSLVTTVHGDELVTSRAQKQVSGQRTLCNLGIIMFYKNNNKKVNK